MKTPNQELIDRMVIGYTCAIEFSESESGEILTPASRSIAKDLCTKFYTENIELVDAYAKVIWTKVDNGFFSIGFDLWFTSKGHGTGFWDRNFDKEMETQLTELSKKYALEVYVENGEITLE